MYYSFVSLVCSLLVSCFLTGLQAQDESFPFRNESLSLDQRIDDLLGRLTLQEKAMLLGYNGQGIPRLGIPAYNWWNEGLHGVARAGNATVFPQAIGMAATFDPVLMHRVASVISTEARAKYNLAVANDQHLQYMGLTFWSPNINIFRDPRWGRGQETYGEDPFLTAQMGVAFVKGLQGTDTKELKVAAGAKHFAVHSGPESERHAFNAVVSEKDLRETYLYAFKKLSDANVEAIMCAYNRMNGEPCCTGPTLLRNILRQEWGFRGHLVTDCWALQDIWERHKVMSNSVEVAAAAVKAGINMDCSNMLRDDVPKAVAQKLLEERDVDAALRGSLRTLFRLGFFNRPEHSPYYHYGRDSVANAYHRSLARTAAQRSVVLLKNKGQLLPLNTKKFPAIMVVGPNASSLDALLGSYHGVSDDAVNMVEGITRAVGPEVRIEYDLGCDYRDTVRFGGIWAASNANITIACLGLTPVYEGEEGDAFLADGGADRKTLGIPASHVAYLKALRKGTRTPIVVVINAGSAVDVAAIEPYADAILLAWYPGQEGGNAVADILFGKVSPSGRLPITLYKSLADLPAYGDYSMKGRTYRYFSKEVQYPFGFGLSYTEFSYAWVRQPQVLRDTIRFSIEISNTGDFSGHEVAQAYVSYPNGNDLPIQELKGVQTVHLLPGEKEVVEFGIPVMELRKWNDAVDRWMLPKGAYQMRVGSHSGEAKLAAKLQF